MKVYSTSLVILFSLSLFTCQNSKPNHKVSYEKIVQESYELHRPLQSPQAVIFLFGGYNESPEDIEREFQILELAKEKQLAIGLWKMNQNLWLSPQEKESWTQEVLTLLSKHDLLEKKLFIGGFSSGGNMALLLGNLLNTKPEVNLKGLFVVDSPIDLLRLYEVAQKNVERNFSAVSMQEAQWIIKNLEEHIGTPETDLNQFEKLSPYIAQSHKLENLADLNGVNIRLYTEPDTLWWKVNRANEYQELNAYGLKLLSKDFQARYPKSKTELIETVDKGYRSNGDKHPHSWSIVDKSELMKWILEN